MVTNWAGSHTYAAARIERPGSLDELSEVVASHPRVRALGSRHSFTDIADTSGVLVRMDGLPQSVQVDQARQTVTVSGGAVYGTIAEQLQQRGWALANLASLPHISVAGAVATGTHGSGDRNQSLAAAVAAMDVMGPDGTVRTLARGDADFDGNVVALGALGLVTNLTLDIQPSYDVCQDVYTGLPWEVLDGGLDRVTGSAYSVSLFTDWVSPRVDQVWLKARDSRLPTDLFGAVRAPRRLHMLAEATNEAVTEQGGVAGPWLHRLPHFRMGFTPSSGEELQSEYLLPRASASTALARLRAIGGRFAPVLQVSEIRTVAADRLWLSGCYDTDVVAIHFTWVRDPTGVYAVLPDIEDALLPLGGRPHWGKCFLAGAQVLAELYPRMPDFVALRRRVDPGGKFDNAYLRRVLGEPRHDCSSAESASVPARPAALRGAGVLPP